MARLRHCYPVNHRPAKVLERRKYYESLDFNKIAEWFSSKPDSLKKPIFHLDPGYETGYCRKKYRDKLGKLLYFDIKDYDELKEMVLEYLPEDLYYDRNLYDDPSKCVDCEDRNCQSCENLLGQELMFDVDPENIECPNCGSLEERIRVASMFKFCYICFNKGVEQALRLKDLLSEKGFQRLSAVYSGRGFHIYVEDPHAYEMTRDERKSLAMEVKNQGIGIDLWVTEGGSRLARVPYSLNGLVSRVCYPIEISEIKKLDFWHSRPFVPVFL
jgi:DNA primase catalytic subunit